MPLSRSPFTIDSARFANEAAFPFFLFPPELHHVPAACKAFVLAHKAAIVVQKRTRREKDDGGCYSRSDRRSQSVLLKAEDKKGKARRVISIQPVRGKHFSFTFKLKMC